MANPLIKQTLSPKLLQKLSPQQIQLMKLLQIPTATLDQRIKEELEANPALEESEDQEEIMDSGERVEDNYDSDNSSDEEKSEEYDEEFELDDYLEEYIEDDPSSYKLRSDNYNVDEEERTIPISVEHSFHEHLKQQLGLMELEDERSRIIAHQIIGSIDNDGYLRRDPISILDDLMFSQNITASKEEVFELLKKIQQFDPPGVGARNLQECLKIQLERKIKKTKLQEEDRKHMNLALQIISNYFNSFAKKHYVKLKRQTGAEDADLKYAIDEILKLNPKPASSFNGGGTRRNINYVIPDFIIVNRDGELDLTLNSRNAPDLQISDQYKDMLKAYKVRKKSQRTNRQEKEAVMFIKQKIDSAKWFIDAIRQRQETMYRAMYAILQYQYEYFVTGDQKNIKPMILKDIAEITGLDISTVSRVANSKFIQTEFGTKRLKDFFSESIKTKDGEEVSTLEVKKILSDIISNENKRKPLSDEKLKNHLCKKGYNIARRTVAKYREQLNIPVARLRKEL